jgi:hypothetical protein
VLSRRRLAVAYLWPLRLGLLRWRLRSSRLGRFWRGLWLLELRLCRLHIADFWLLGLCDRLARCLSRRLARPAGRHVVCWRISWGEHWLRRLLRLLLRVAAVSATSRGVSGGGPRRRVSGSSSHRSGSSSIVGLLRLGRLLRRRVRRRVFGGHMAVAHRGRRGRVIAASASTSTSSSARWVAGLWQAVRGGIGAPPLALALLLG